MSLIGCLIWNIFFLVSIFEALRVPQGHELFNNPTVESSAKNSNVGVSGWYDVNWVACEEDD